MNRKKNLKPNQTFTDWADMRKRMAELKADLGMDNEPPLEVLKRVWADHALQLSKPVAKEQEGQRVDLVIVKMGDEVYALEVDCVFEIRPVEKITFVPHVPEWVSGVYNLRGHILSVVDLSRFLALPQPAGRESVVADSILVIAKTDKMECAFRVDQILAVDVISVASIQAASELVRGLSAEYVHGVLEWHGNEGDFTTSVLNIRAILNDQRLVVDQESV